MRNTIRLLILDVDGTMTDGKIYMGQGGELCKAFSSKDGYGIRHMLPPAGIVPVILTGRDSEIVARRSRELGIEALYQGVDDKGAKLEELLGGFGVGYAAVAYMGDDLNDWPCMEAVKAAGGLVGCPSDAVEAVRNIADFIAPHRGGDGAVRDFIEWLLERGSCPGAGGPAV